jgi:charged multivesicular body protein 5
MYFFNFQNMQDEMTDLMDVSNEIQETLGRSYNIPDDVDEEELMGGMETLISSCNMTILPAL